MKHKNNWNKKYDNKKPVGTSLKPGKHEIKFSAKVKSMETNKPKIIRPWVWEKV